MEGCHRDAIETSKHVHGRPCSRFSSPPDRTLKRIAVSFIERNTFGFEKYFIYVHAREQKGGREKVWKRMDEIYIYIYIGFGEAKNLLEAWIPIRRIHRLYPGTQFTRGSARDILTDFNRHYCY